MKIKSIIILLVIIIIVAVISVFITSNYYLNKEKQNNNTNNNSNTLNSNNLKYVEFNGRNTVHENTENMNYALSDFVNLNGDEVEIIKTRDKFELYNNTYGKETLVSNQKDNTYKATITGFKSKVIGYFEGGLGHEITGKIHLFILEDGTIEYIKEYTMFKDNSFVSEGKLENVKDIVRIEQGFSSYPQGGGARDIFLIRNDGKFYSLNEILEGENNK